MKELIGELTISNTTSIAIVVSRFNERITRNLLRGATETLQRFGLPEEKITVVWVPGAFEIPLAAKKLTESGHYDAVICLGAVIRGATPHFDYVCNAAAAGISQVSMETDIPVIFGVLTCDTVEQAVERSGCKAGNKGADAAQCAIEMASLMDKLSLSSTGIPATSKN